MIERVAILSFHSHDDRSFLDDRELALASGDLRRLGVDNDLIIVHLPEGVTEAPTRLARMLASYDVVFYERVWSAALIESLRAELPGVPFVACQGEHRLLSPPASYECRGELRRAIPALVEHLAGRRAAPPGTRRNAEGRWERVEPIEALADGPLPFEPNLAPIYLDPDAAARPRVVSVVGNPGCPYQADARANPLYGGVSVPEGIGRGCAFCTTGNRYEHSAPEVTAARVLEQLRYVCAAGLRTVVLKDQNPFAWLPELVEQLDAPMTLLLETRVDWFVRNAGRFERALELAAARGVALAPYLIGIESFAQIELDRFNKGIRAEDNVAFLESLDRWEAEHPRSLDLSHASFGFVLFTPWTSVSDLAVNHAAILRTGLDRFRGSVLLSRARLYPDTALYWLAERDGLLAPEWPRLDADSAARYGYFPGHPWRFRDPTVEHFASLATVLTERLGGRDQRRLFGALLQSFETSPRPSSEEVLRAMSDQPPLPTADELRTRLSALIRPLAIDEPFAGGWTIASLDARPNRLRIGLRADGDALTVDLVPRSDRAAYARTLHYDVRHLGRGISKGANRALEALCGALVANDHA